MKLSEQAAPVLHQRRIHYVDESIQKALLLALVLLEVALATGLAWLMWERLNAIVEDNLYRIHLADAQPILSQLLQEAGRLLGIFVMVNVVALVLVDVFWRRYVQSILRSFMLLMGKTCALDYSADVPVSARHQLLDLAQAQRELDRHRLSAVRDSVSRLVAAQQAGDATVVQQALDVLNETIPKGRTSRPERRVGS